MRLFEAVIEANHRAVAGDQNAGLHPAEFADELPVVALTCMDERLNPLLPEVLGLPEDEFIWVRNAGNIITGPLSSTMRSLAVATALKGAKEIAIIGHTDCLMGKTTMMQLLDKLAAAGVPRSLLPENLTEYFGIFSSERQNVIKACDLVRHSPLISGKVPVQGLLVDIETGRVEWLVTFETVPDKLTSALKTAGQTVGALEELGKFTIGEMKFPETKIGEVMSTVHGWVEKAEQVVERKPTEPSPTTRAVPTTAQRLADFALKHWPRPEEETEQPPGPPKIPVPPPIRMKMGTRKDKR
jgi:carbonic anhydrase